MHTEITVEGMTCGHCVSAVTGELNKISGVTGVIIDLASGLVEIESDHELAPADLLAAVDEAGYTVVNS